MVGNCGTSAEALEVLKGSPADVVLLDFDLGEDHGSQFSVAGPAGRLRWKDPDGDRRNGCGRIVHRLAIGRVGHLSEAQFSGDAG
jgi:hypothetical protein